MMSLGGGGGGGGGRISWRSLPWASGVPDRYIPNPQRCFQCQKFGHTKNSCKGKAVSAGCGEEGHNLDDCQNDPKCVNCQGDHVAISRDCPKWKIEKDIVTLKYAEKDFICRCSQTFTTLFRPIKGFICNCNTDPSSMQDLFHPGQKKSDFQLTLRPRLSI